MLTLSSTVNSSCLIKKELTIWVYVSFSESESVIFSDTKLPGTIFLEETCELVVKLNNFKTTNKLNKTNSTVYKIITYGFLPFFNDTL